MDELDKTRLALGTPFEHGCLWEAWPLVVGHGRDRLVDCDDYRYGGFAA